MNTRISHLFIALTVALCALIVMTTYWQVWARSSLEARQSNVRLVYRDLEIDRGSIVSSDGVVLAESNPAQLDGRTVYKRVYPTKGLAAQLVGYSSLLAGRAGLERSLDPELSGSTGDLAGVTNAFDRMRGNTVRGNEVVLRLQAVAQKVAMDRLTALGVRGSVVVLDPSTGGILVMASTPTFDPNNGLEAALKNPASPLLNRATQGLYPPGSTFKVVTAASALDAGSVTPDTKFSGPSCINTGGQPLCNFRGRAYGPHNFGYAFVHSINTTFAKVGIDLGAEQLRRPCATLASSRAFPGTTQPNRHCHQGSLTAKAISYPRPHQSTWPASRLARSAYSPRHSRWPKLLQPLLTVVRLCSRNPSKRSGHPTARSCGDRRRSILAVP